MSLPGAIVIDVETTGFTNNDRVVEIAAISLKPESWEIEDEYETLINPERDLGPTGVHQITPSMVELAPVFSEIVADLARRMKGMVMIAHNASFDARMLVNEFERLDVRISLGNALCTLRETGSKLSYACEEYGIELDNAHRALADARATAKLANSLWHPSENPSCTAIQIGDIAHKPGNRTLTREAKDFGQSPMRRIVSRAPYPHADEAICCYLDTLDRVLDDAFIDKHEYAELQELAMSLGLSDERQHQAHVNYLRCMINAAIRDDHVSTAERCLIEKIADQLGVGHDEIPNVTEIEVPDELSPGMKVCFTGQAVINGKAVERKELVQMAEKAGMVAVKSVTKNNCDLLVAMDTSSSSTKGTKAKKYRIPVITVTDFVSRVKQ